MTGLKLRWGQVGVALALAACVAPAPTPQPSVAAGDTPAVLCDANDEASLSGLADELSRWDGSTMPEGLGDQAREMRERLEPLVLGPDATSVRDSAVAALLDLESEVGERGVGPESATVAALTMRELESLICPASG